MRRRRKNKRNIKIFVGLIICLLLIMTAGYAAFRTNINIIAKGNVNPRNNLYVSSTGNDQTGRGTKDRPYQTISKAYDSAAGEATIYVMDNLTIDETINFDKDKKITLTSEETEINSLLRGEEDEALLTLSSGETIFTNITLDGQNKEADYVLLRCENNVEVSLNMGTTLQNNKNNNDGGGAVSMSYVRVVIDGAKIINNYSSHGGGGILARHSILTINDVEISGNSAYDGGGIFFGDRDGLLTMNGGIIMNNKSRVGGGIKLASANMVMTGGEISTNTSNTSGGAIILTNVTQTPNVGSTFIFQNGQIVNNTADSVGGGIFVSLGTYTNEGGIVSDNIPDDVYEE